MTTKVRRGDRVLLQGLRHYVWNTQSGVVWTFCGFPMSRYGTADHDEPLTCLRCMRALMHAYVAWV